MSNRISQLQLEKLCDHLNKVLGTPTTAYTRLEDGKLRANVGNYHISGAYGGVCLHQMTNEQGGVTTPLVYGHVPKRELYEKMQAFLRGIEVERENQNRARHGQ